MTSPPRQSALCSWSGGKDSCLALHVAMDAGLDVTTLLTVLEPDADRSRSHALPEHLLRAQAHALGMTLVTPRASWTNYEPVFIEALKAAAKDGCRTAVFGDIDLQPHRDWEEKVCAAAGITAELPLWNLPRARIVEDLFERGLQAICVCVNTHFLPKEFCGRRYDRQFIADLPPGVDACGENGEFHTFVTHAPRFRAPVDANVKRLSRYVGPAEFGAQEFWFAELA